jgi:hypothetical protein
MKEGSMIARHSRFPLDMMEARKKLEGGKNGIQSFENRRESVATHP